MFNVLSCLVCMRHDKYIKSLKELLLNQDFD